MCRNFLTQPDLIRAVKWCNSETDYVKRHQCNEHRCHRRRKRHLQGHATGLKAVKQLKQKRQRLYDDWKRYVLRCFLKVFKEVTERTASGRLFHTRAAATPSAQSPMVQHRVRGTISL